jgi:hypothetical protein
VSAEHLLQRALQRARVGVDGGRNGSGLWLACQLRDNGYSRDEAEPVMRRYAESFGAESPPYQVEEALASLRQAYARPPRAPWRGRAARGSTWRPPEQKQAERDAELHADPLAWLQANPIFARVPIASVRKLGRSRGEYDLLLSDGRAIELGTAQQVMTQRAVKAAILDATAVAIDVPKGANWDDVAEAICQAAELVDCCEPDDELRSWLETRKYGEYGSQIKMIQALHWNAVVHDDEGNTHVNLREFRKRLLHEGVKITQPDLSRRLRRAGFRDVQFSARDPEKGYVIKARVWTAPPGWYTVHTAHADLTELSPLSPVCPQSNGDTSNPIPDSG